MREKARPKTCGSSGAVFRLFSRRRLQQEAFFDSSVLQTALVFVIIWQNLSLLATHSIAGAAVAAAVPAAAKHLRVVASRRIMVRCGASTAAILASRRPAVHCPCSSADNVDSR